MSPVWKTIVVFAALVAYRCLRYHVCALRIRAIREAFWTYLQDGNADAAPVSRRIIELKALLKEAGVSEDTIPFTEFAGFGQILRGTISAIDNMTLRRADVASTANELMHRAEGEFVRRRNESFNPVFWIEYAVRLPGHLLQYLGVSPDNVAAKSVDVVYWLALIALGVAKWSGWGEELMRLIRGLGR